MHILIVDDEKEICEEFRDIMQEAKHTVDIALRGEDAIKMIEGGGKFDVVFLDVLMPRMEGRQVMEAIKKIVNVPVVIISGYVPPNKEREIIELGAIACLKKPLDLDRVHSLLRSLGEKK